MTRTVGTSPGNTVHERYRQLIVAGFNQHEAASLIALVDGIDRHAEGESPSGATWRWQEIARLEFLRFLAETGRLLDGGDAAPASDPALLPPPALNDTVTTLSEAEARSPEATGYASFG
jgi:hypothetical protein